VKLGGEAAGAKRAAQPYCWGFRKTVAVGAGYGA